MSAATPAITMTVIAWPIAVVSASISWNVFTSPFIAPTMRSVRLAIQPPAAGVWARDRDRVTRHAEPKAGTQPKTQTLKP